MRVIHRAIVAAMIISKDGKLLLGRKNPIGGGVYADAWHIPGGGIEEGEEKIDALIREIREEVGIDISQYPIELVDDTGEGVSEKTLKNSDEIVECHMKFYVYKVTIYSHISNDIHTVLSDDIEQVVWTRMEELSKYKLTPPSIALFKKLGLLRGNAATSC